MNALQEAIHYSFIKFCIYCFSLLYEFFVHYALRVEKNYQHGLDAGSLGFQFLWLRGCLTNPLRTLCQFVSRSYAKHQVSYPVIILFKKFLSASAIVIMFWKDVTWSSLCSGVKECGTKCSHNFLSQILFQNQKNYRLRDVQRFCYNSWCDSMVIFWPNQQQQQCLPQSESILDSNLSCLLPAPFRLEIKKTTQKRLIGSQPNFHRLSAPILVFLLQIDQLWNKILWQISVHFRHPWRIKKPDFTRQVITHTLSKIKKWNSVCEQMLLDST